MLEHYLMILILGGFPIAEVRGSIIYAAALNINLWHAFAIGAIGNIIAIPIIFLVLGRLNLLSLAKRLFGKRTYLKIEKHQHHIDRWGVLALLIFVAIPLPFTGGWTGAFVATLLKMDKKKSFLVIALGILIAGLITIAAVQSTITGLTILNQ
ncbi:small multi-drug export protein [Candidatus Woesearchaeota archaeon]|jgi:uncharacterized membrane protein|nr:small multi-drug export protein [Candidatus Woesearchaeota archaeon]MBT4114644.1 small multi-drug export protein [Candidatus Woesearchaeota archaeon]MBT4248014.1 small multi-drug export protein [Candidatus Woesearchaeota archaeon]